MTDQDSSYRPQSPDFSTLHSPISPALRPSNTYTFSNPLAHRASYDASPFFTPQYQQHPAGPPPPLRVPQQYGPPFPDPQLDPDMARRSSRLARAAEGTPVAPAPAPPVPAPAPAPMAMPMPMPMSMPPAETKYVDPVSAAPQPPVEEAPLAAPLAPAIEVKTKFPVARIKRIMQADEDVGKVAQVTPIAVSKALELFMISLVTKAAKEAKDRNSKRVTASHLKQAVVKDDVLDFLADIIAKVPDQPASRKHEDDGSDGNDPPKRKRGGRRPKDESD